MMAKIHHYRATVSWTGNLGAGTTDYKGYSRDHAISVEGKPALLGSADAAFRGDKSRYTPEDLLLCSLTGCHMLWYLHLCSANGIVVTDYEDHAVGEMLEKNDGGGQFTKVTLHPRVTVTQQAMVGKAASLHKEADRLCFIARSVNFPLDHKPEIICSEQA